MSMPSEKQAAKPWDLAESEQVPGLDVMNTPMPQQDQSHDHEEGYWGVAHHIRYEDAPSHGAA